MRMREQGDALKRHADQGGFHFDNENMFEAGLLFHGRLKRISQTQPEENQRGRLLQVMGSSCARGRSRLPGIVQVKGSPITRRGQRGVARLRGRGRHTIGPRQIRMPHRISLIRAQGIAFEQKSQIVFNGGVHGASPRIG